jgi:hypothetical protein
MSGCLSCVCVRFILYFVIWLEDTRMFWGVLSLLSHLSTYLTLAR